MELKDFVSASLVQILEGIVEAQKKVGEIGGFVNPTDSHASSSISGKKQIGRFASIPTIKGHHLNEVHDIEFDVAVTVTERRGAGQASASRRLSRLADRRKVILRLNRLAG